MQTIVGSDVHARIPPASARYRPAGSWRSSPPRRRTTNHLAYPDVWDLTRWPHRLARQNRARSRERRTTTSAAWERQARSLLCVGERRARRRPSSRRPPSPHPRRGGVVGMAGGVDRCTPNDPNAVSRSSNAVSVARPLPRPPARTHSRTRLADDHGSRYALLRNRRRGPPLGSTAHEYTSSTATPRAALATTRSWVSVRLLGPVGVPHDFRIRGVHVHVERVCRTELAEHESFAAQSHVQHPAVRLPPVRADSRSSN